MRMAQGVCLMVMPLRSRCDLLKWQPAAQLAFGPLCAGKCSSIGLIQHVTTVPPQYHPRLLWKMASRQLRFVKNFESTPLWLAELFKTNRGCR